MFKTFINCIILLSLCLNVLASSEDESATKKPEATDKNVFSKNLVKVNIKPKEILKSANHIGKKNLNIKKFPNDILGYTTPWNKAGEKNVLECINKFTMVSPVWLRVLHGEINDIFGTEDINNKWLSELRSSRLSRNVTIKILPRILFESWTVDSLSELYRNIQLRDRFIRTLYELAEYHHFDGYVLELWNPYLASKSKKTTITNLINEIAKGLKKKYLYTVLVIPPHRGSSDVSFTEKDFNSLVKNVHAFSLMTYDYSNMQNPGPNAPISWIRKSIEYICPNQDDPNRKKILMGLNFYGYFYTHSGGRAILGHEYLKMLKSYKGDLKWDHKSKEHFFELTSTNSDGEHGFVFYPTLYSISKRIELATEMNTGIAIWELGQGLDFFFDLL